VCEPHAASPITNCWGFVVVRFVAPRRDTRLCPACGAPAATPTVSLGHPPLSTAILSEKQLLSPLLLLLLLLVLTDTQVLAASGRLQWRAVVAAAAALLNYDARRATHPIHAPQNIADALPCP
jgi:hypothetical protein